MRLIMLGILLGALTACATIEDVAPIKYTSGPASPVAGAQPVALSTVDGRTADRTRISTKINGFGMEMAAIRSAKDVPSIVRDALAAEFEARGFHIDQAGAPVTVTVDRFYNQFHTGALAGKANGEVGLTVVVADKRGAQLYSRSISGTSEIAIILANGSNAAESVAAALKDAINKLFADADFIAAVTRPVS